MSRIKPVREHRRREAPQEGKDWWEWANRMLMRRAGGCCEMCLKSVTADRAERHHRQKRRDGGDRLSNLLYLCSICHRWVTEHPAAAMDLGLIVRSLGDPKPDPAAIPVSLGFGEHRRIVLLDDNGYSIALNR